MHLLPYQSKITLQNNLPPAELALHKKQVISAYLMELESRMWDKFQSESWGDDVEAQAARTKEIVIELSKDINKEWNNHRASVPDCWLPFNGFIQLASVAFDFPVKFVPIMK